MSRYVYSINNGAYQDSNVFNGLTENTTYTINVKAIDNNNRESNPYAIQVTTDTYQVPTITNVSTSSTSNSITINVTASNGDGNITTYMYSRDNGSNWYESTSNSYTFSGLTSNTTFYVQVKVVDNNGKESAVSNTTVTTVYINPTVNSVSASNITSNSVRLTVSATAGSNSIRTYYYSSNNGSSYVSSSSNSYTFSGLSAGTTYTFRVYVVDSGGVKSNERTTSATTSYVNPTANSVSVTEVTSDSITVSVSASGGTNSVRTYYYSINNGAYTSSTSNSYTFSGLNPSTTYSIRVYVADTAGRTSNTVSTTGTTEDDGSFEFVVYFGDTPETFTAYEGMTWQDFIYSPYNTGSFAFYRALVVVMYSNIDIYFVICEGNENPWIGVDEYIYPDAIYYVDFESY